MFSGIIEEVGKVIHDLYEELVEVRKQNAGLRNANEIYSKENIRLVAQLENDEHNAQTNKVR